MCGQNQAYDLCFELLTEQPWVKGNQPFTGIRNWQNYEDEKSMALESEEGELSISRQIADDLLCKSMDPVTAIAWNGSYIGYGYEACKCEEVPELRKPDYFLLSIRDNVHTSTAEPNNYPGEKIWEYTAYDYDEVLVGYDRNPEDEPNEPVFRYCVRLPEDEWFRQENPEQIYWFSVIAVFKEITGEIPYQWGWTNHSHMFGSAALARDFNPDTMSQWQPLLDATDRLIDMSFTLFTVTMKISLMLSVPSLAVTVIVEAPSPVSVMVSVDPEIPTVTAEVLLLVAESVSASPSLSLNTVARLMVAVPKPSS